MGKLFTKGLDKSDQKEGLLKRLKNIEDKNEELLKAKNKIENTKEVTDYADAKDANFRKLEIKSGNNVDYDFSDYKTFKELFKGLYYKKITIDEAQGEQDEFNAIIDVLEDYTPRNNKHIEAKNKLLNNVKKFYEGREKIIEGFKNRIFPFNYDKADEEQLQSKNNSERNKIQVGLINSGLNDLKKRN